MMHKDMAILHKKSANKAGWFKFNGGLDKIKSDKKRIKRIISQVS